MLFFVCIYIVFVHSFIAFFIHIQTRDVTHEKQSSAEIPQVNSLKLVSHQAMNSPGRGGPTLSRALYALMSIPRTKTHQYNNWKCCAARSRWV